MNRFFIVFIGFLILFQSLGKLLIMTNYVVNKSYITAVLCENKNKPKMHCNGKCHLVKQLQKEDKTSPVGQNELKQKIEPQWLNEAGKGKLAINFVAIDFNTVYIEKDYHAPKRIVFHPPLPATII